MTDQSFRVERDSMGELQVPEDALWGAQTQRAVNNFPISGLTMPRAFIRAAGHRHAPQFKTKPPDSLDGQRYAHVRHGLDSCCDARLDS